MPNARYWESENDRRIYFEPHSICGKRIVGLRFCVLYTVRFLCELLLFILYFLYTDKILFVYIYICKNHFQKRRPKSNKVL